MCQSAAEGGRRCAAHTRAALDRARAAMDADPANYDAYEALTDALAFHASTPTGERELREQLDEYDPSDPERVDLQAALDRGAALRERANAAQAAHAAATAARTRLTPPVAVLDREPERDPAGELSPRYLDTVAALPGTTRATISRAFLRDALVNNTAGHDLVMDGSTPEPNVVQLTARCDTCAESLTSRYSSVAGVFLSGTNNLTGSCGSTD